MSKLWKYYADNVDDYNALAAEGWKPTLSTRFWCWLGWRLSYVYFFASPAGMRVMYWLTRPMPKAFWRAKNRLADWAGAKAEAGMTSDMNSGWLSATRFP